MLFETGPGNHWLVTPWARRAPRPRGGSFAIEVYRRLPNDTDFSILDGTTSPASTSPSSATATPTTPPATPPTGCRRRAMRDTGGTWSAILDALQQTGHHTQRTPREPTYFDVGGTSPSAMDRRSVDVVRRSPCVRASLAWLRVTRFLRTRRRGRPVAARFPGLDAGRRGGVVAAMVAATVAAAVGSRGVSPVVRESRPVLPDAGRCRRRGRLGDGPRSAAGSPPAPAVCGIRRLSGPTRCRCGSAGARRRRGSRRRPPISGPCRC